MAVEGTLPSYVSGASDVTEDVDKMSKTSFSTCNEDLKNAFVMSFFYHFYCIQFGKHLLNVYTIHIHSFSSLAELQRTIEF